MINKQNITSGLFICWNIVFLEHFSIFNGAEGAAEL